MFSRLGEQTGTLPAMLQSAANQLSAEVQRRAADLATAEMGRLPQISLPQAP